MKLIYFLSMLSLVTAFYFITPCYAEDSEDNRKIVPEHNSNNDNHDNEHHDNNDNHNNNDNRNQGGNENHNFNNDNHTFIGNHDYNDSEHHNFYSPNYRHFRYHDYDYDFNDYYRQYRTEGSLFTYHGHYAAHDDIFIFTDIYDNEFDLYIKPVDVVSRWFQGTPLEEGQSYNLTINSTKMYVTPDELNLGLSFTFGWGNLSMQNNKYFDMYTAPELVNIQGQLYIRN